MDAVRAAMAAGSIPEMARKVRRERPEDECFIVTEEHRGGFASVIQREDTFLPGACQAYRM
jgi:hypothetical protein